MRCRLHERNSGAKMENGATFHGDMAFAKRERMQDEMFICRRNPPWWHKRRDSNREVSGDD